MILKKEITSNDLNQILINLNNQNTLKNKIQNISEATQIKDTSEFELLIKDLPPLGASFETTLEECAQTLSILRNYKRNNSNNLDESQLKTLNA